MLSAWSKCKSTRLNLGTGIGHPDWASPLTSSTIPDTCWLYCLTAGYDWFLQRLYQSHIRRHKLQADGLSLAKFLLRFLCWGTYIHTYISVYVCMYVYIYIYIRTYIHIHLHIYFSFCLQSQYFQDLWRVLVS